MRSGLRGCIAALTGVLGCGSLLNLDGMQFDRTGDESDASCTSSNCDAGADLSADVATGEAEIETTAKLASDALDSDGAVNDVDADVTADEDLPDTAMEAESGKPLKTWNCANDGVAPLVCQAPQPCLEKSCGGILWPGGRIPYEFDASLPEPIRALVIRAAQDWSNATSLVTFANCGADGCASGNSRWLRVISGADVSLDSPISSGPQVLRLPDVTSEPYRVAHELGRVIGLPELWERSDRDQHARLSSTYFCGVTEGRRAAYKCRSWAPDTPIHPPSTTGLFGPFDSTSVMNLVGGEVCTNDGRHPDAQSTIPTAWDGSAVTELYRTSDGWTPFAPLASETSPTTPLNYGPNVSVKLVGSPGMGTWGYPTLDVYARGNNGHIYSRWKNVSSTEFHSWTPWADFGCCFDSDPSAYSWAYGHSDLVARHTDGDIYWKTVDVGISLDWSQWQSIGKPAPGAASAPALSSWGKNRLDVFVRGGDNRLYQKTFDSVWSADWVMRGDIEFLGKPAAVSRPPDKIDIVVTGTDQAVWRLSYSATWDTKFVPLGGSVDAGSSPAIASWGGDRLDVFIAGATDHRLYQKYWDGSWSGWRELGGVLSGSPAAVGDGSNQAHIDIVAPIDDRGNTGMWWKFMPYVHPCYVDDATCGALGVNCSQ